MLSSAQGELAVAEILPLHYYNYQLGSLVIYEPIKSGSISEDRFYQMVGIEMGLKLLQANVFAYHVTFQS
jgi:hypothetical protein